MNMIGHDDERMELITVKFVGTVPQGSDHHFRDLRLSQILGTEPIVVEKSIHSYKSSARRNDSGWRKDTTPGKAAMQAEGYKYGVADQIPMGQTPFIAEHTDRFPCNQEILNKLWGGQSCPQPAFSRHGRLKGGRSHDWLPHQDSN